MHSIHHMTSLTKDCYFALVAVVVNLVNRWIYKWHSSEVEGLLLGCYFFRVS